MMLIVRYTYAGNRERAYADVTKNSENAKAQVYSLYTDRQGSTRWALDENAEVAAKTEYDAWGKPETETVSSKLNGINISKSYTGYVYDETTGYWNAGARMYNSTDREFIQKDPKVGNVYETLTQNGYIYCGDNPLYYIDPDGCSYISTLGNAGRTAFNVVKSGVTGGLGFYTRICCEIDNMPTWAKAAVGTTGIIIAGASGVGAAAIAEAVIASAGISAATDGAFYSIYALNNGSFSKSELKDTVINGAVNGYMFGGAGVGVAGIRNATKSGKIAGFMADEAGSVKFDGGSWKKSGKNTTTTIDYSYKFDRELANFNDGYEIRTTVDKNLILVQYSSDAPDASLCYWTTVDEANRIATLNDYMDKLALSKDWGNRNIVRVSRIPAGTEVKYAVGTAREQLLISDPRPGGGVQYLFNQFDTDWITEIRNLAN